MKSDPDRLLTLALRLADGETLDWSRESEALALADRGLLDSFRTLATIGEIQKAAPSEPKDAIGRYEILDRIGQGSNGDVYRAKDRTLGRVVALKLLRPRGAVHDVFARADLLEEARRLASVKHPNVVLVYDAERVDGREAIALEYIRGKTLGAIVREQGALPAGEIAAIGRALAGALGAVHAAGLLHLDVKPDNVMREDGGRIVLMDFAPGSATPMCAAPEVLRGEPASARADVFGAAVVLFHLATGEFPFTAKTIEELREAHRRGTIASLRALRPDFPVEFARAIDEAMSIDPALRPGTMADFARAFEAGAAVAAGPEAAAREAAGRPRGGRRGVFVAVGAAAAIALAAFAWNARRGAQVAAPATATVPPAGASAKASEATPPDIATSSAAPAPASVEVRARFHRKSRTGGTSALRDGDAVAVGDSLAMTFTASDSMYVYVVNEDDRGEAFLLFPLPSLDRQNPLSPGAPVAIPGTRAGEPTSWIVTSAGGRERIILVASRDRLESLEAELFAMERAQIDRAASAAPIGESTKRLLRGIGGLARPETAPRAESSPRPPLLAELASPLTDRAETVTGVWVRRVEFVNTPGDGGADGSVKP